MKNQNDLILSIVSAVIAIGVVIGIAVTKPEPAAPQAAPKVNEAKLTLPAADVVYANALPGAGAAAGGRGGFPGMGGGGMPGGRGGRGGKGAMASAGRM